MRRLLLFCLLLFPLPFAGQAQVNERAENYDAYMECLRTSKRASIDIPALYQLQDAAGIDSLLYEWKYSCGGIQPLMYFEIVYSIGAGQFNENIYHNQIIRSLAHFREELAADNAAGKKTRARDYGIDSNYYSFVSAMAGELYEEDYARSPVEYWLLRFLSTADTALFAELDNIIYNNTRLQESYHNWLAEQPGGRGVSGFCAEFAAGAWLPDGALGRIGAHPLLGLEVGVGSENFTASLYFNIRFGKAPRPYKVFADSLFSTRYHFGTGVGLNLRYVVRKGRRSDVVGLGSIGYDVLTVRPDPDTDDETVNGVNRKSLALGLGAGYRFFVGSQVYIGLEGRYNLLFYNNSGGSDLGGNAFLLTLSVGQSGGSYKRLRGGGR